MHPEVRRYVERVMNSTAYYLEENPEIMKIVGKALLAAPRKASPLRATMCCVKGALDGMGLLGLWDCSSKSPSESGYIVEGSAQRLVQPKKGRDNRTQAILPPTRWVLNTERARLE